MHEADKEQSRLEGHRMLCEFDCVQCRAKMWGTWHQQSVCPAGLIAKAFVLLNFYSGTHNVILILLACALRQPYVHRRSRRTSTVYTNLHLSPILTRQLPRSS